MSDPMADPMALDLWHLAQRDSKGQILVITDLGYRIADMIENIVQGHIDHLEDGR